MGKSYQEGYDIKYCYPGTNVLKNKLNIMDADELHEVERKITTAKLVYIQQHPVKGNFDKKHLQMLHKTLFEDMYEWAGKFRTVDIAKGNMFCNVRFLEGYGADIFERLRKDMFLIGMSQTNAMKKLAQYMGDINAWHPFREGNGRTQREFIQMLANGTGYFLNYSAASPEEMMEASKKSFMCDYSLYEDIIARISEPMPLEQQKDFLKKVSKEGLKIFEQLLKENQLPDRTKAPLGKKIDGAAREKKAIVRASEHTKDRDER